MLPRTARRALLSAGLVIGAACSSTSGSEQAATPAPADGGVLLDAGADTAVPDSGDAGDSGSTLDATPPDEVNIPAPGGAYAIDTREITFADYMQFRATTSAAPAAIAGCAWKTSLGPSAACTLPPGDDPARPMTCIDWCDAQAYCVSRGKHLCARIGGSSTTTTAQRLDPLADEWTRACGGPVPGERWPYGTTAVPTACNTAERDAGTTIATRSLPGCKSSTEVVFDMSGNAAEWEDSCLADAGSADAASHPCAVRGGSFLDTATNASCTRIAELARAETSPAVGARCCKDLQQ